MNNGTVTVEVDATQNDLPSVSPICHLQNDFSTLEFWFEHGKKETITYWILHFAMKIEQKQDQRFTDYSQPKLAKMQSKSLLHRTSSIAPCVNCFPENLIASMKFCLCIPVYLKIKLYIDYI